MINFKIDKQTIIVSLITLVIGISVASAYWYLNPRVEIKEIPVEKIVEKEVIKEVKTYVLPEPLNTETKDWKVYQSKYGFSFRYPENETGDVGTYIDKDSELGKLNPEEPTNIGISARKNDSYDYPYFSIYVNTLRSLGVDDIETFANKSYGNNVKARTSFEKYGTRVYSYSYKEGFHTVKDEIFEKNGFVYQIQVQSVTSDDFVNKIYSSLVFE
jgi:hypothetical protein